MKKMLAILLALLIVVALVGCGHDATDATNATVATENVQQDQVRVEEETSETTLPMQEVETTPLFVCEYDTTLFYYNQLTSEEQEIYNLIEEKKYDFMSNTPVCILSELNGDLYEGYNPEIAVRALEAYQNDNPLSSIWLADTTVRFWAEVSYPEDGGYIIHEKGYYVAPYGFDYIEGVFNYVDVSGETREEMIAEVEQMISEVEAYTLEIVQTLEGDDHQKIEQINQWVINGCEYSLEGEHIRDVYGCLIEKHCCCAGDAMAVKYVADMAGLNVIVVSGLGITDDKTIEEVKAEFDEEESVIPPHLQDRMCEHGPSWVQT